MPVGGPPSGRRRGQGSGTSRPPPRAGPPDPPVHYPLSSLTSGDAATPSPPLGPRPRSDRCTRIRLGGDRALNRTINAPPPPPPSSGALRWCLGHCLGTYVGAAGSGVASGGLWRRCRESEPHPPACELPAHRRGGPAPPDPGPPPCDRQTAGPSLCRAAASPPLR